MKAVTPPRDGSPPPGEEGAGAEMGVETPAGERPGREGRRRRAVHPMGRGALWPSEARRSHTGACRMGLCISHDRVERRAQHLSAPAAGGPCWIAVAFSWLRGVDPRGPALGNRQEDGCPWKCPSHPPGTTHKPRRWLQPQTHYLAEWTCKTETQWN